MSRSRGPALKAESLQIGSCPVQLDRGLDEGRRLACAQPDAGRLQIFLVSGGAIYPATPAPRRTCAIEEWQLSWS